MYNYILKRILLMIPTLFGAAFLVFFLLRLIPGDVCELRLAGTGLYADPAEIELCQEKLGLNQPMIVQFFDFLIGIVTFDLGESMWTGKPIFYEMGLRFELSLQIAIMATITSIFIAIPLGTISAIKQDTWIDYVVRTFSIAGIAIPSFWYGILIVLGILIFTQSWFGEPWMPPLDYVPIWVDPWRNLSQLIWPALATGYRYSAVATRMTRSAMLEVFRLDFIRTARAKGVRERRVITRHALRYAIVSILPVLGLQAGFVLSGAVYIEIVFQWPGIGRMLVDAILTRDIMLVQGGVLFVAACYVLFNIIVDLAQLWLDPRLGR